MGSAWRLIHHRFGNAESIGWLLGEKSGDPTSPAPHRLADHTRGRVITSHRQPRPTPSGIPEPAEPERCYGARSQAAHSHRYQKARALRTCQSPALAAI